MCQITVFLSPGDDRYRYFLVPGSHSESADYWTGNISAALTKRFSFVFPLSRMKGQDVCAKLKLRLSSNSTIFTEQIDKESIILLAAANVLANSTDQQGAPPDKMVLVTMPEVLHVKTKTKTMTKNLHNFPQKSEV